MESTPPNRAMSSAESEDRFRQIFFAHLESDGYSEADAYQLIFRTPRPFHDVPSADQGPALLDALRRSYQHQLAYSWFFEGFNQKRPADARFLEPSSRPPTFVVFAGIFGEFIEQVPFQTIVDDENSHFRRKWGKALAGIIDQVYSLVDLSEKPCSLSDVVGIGSLDQGEASFANVIVLKTKGGSLETLGSLESNATIFERRLAKIFDVIDEDSDIYLVGYSRGLAVALDLVSSLHELRTTGAIPPASAKWFERVKGVVGLGGVYYGAGFAQDVLTGKSGVTSDLVKLVVDTAARLTTVPADASTANRLEIVRGNARVWAAFVKRISAQKAPKVAAGRTFMGIDLADVVEKEGRSRIRGREVPAPNPWGIFSLVNAFLLETFRLAKFVSRYNQNILSFKHLIDAVVEGLDTLTPASRDAWWQSHRLPKDMMLFSITGIMPDAYLNGFKSPLSQFVGFGARTSDYNVSLRVSYYDAVSSENTLINDSQMSHYCSRYWEQMYPDHQYAHYYLGVLGTHHWGMAFAYSIEDAPRIGGNPFPRATLLKSLASFVSSLD